MPARCSRQRSDRPVRRQQCPVAIDGQRRVRLVAGETKIHRSPRGASQRGRPAAVPGRPVHSRRRAAAHCARAAARRAAPRGEHHLTARLRAAGLDEARCRAETSASSAESSWLMRRRWRHPRMSAPGVRAVLVVGSTIARSPPVPHYQRGNGIALAGLRHHLPNGGSHAKCVRVPSSHDRRRCRHQRDHSTADVPRGVDAGSAGLACPLRSCVSSASSCCRSPRCSRISRRDTSCRAPRRWRSSPRMRPSCASAIGTGDEADRTEHARLRVRDHPGRRRHPIREASGTWACARRAPQGLSPEFSCVDVVSGFSRTQESA